MIEFLIKKGYVKKVGDEYEFTEEGYEHYLETLRSAKLIKVNSQYEST